MWSVSSTIVGWSSAYAVTKMIAILDFSQILFAASTPSISPARLTSIKTISGAVVTALSMASPPLVAISQSSKPRFAALIPGATPPEFRLQRSRPCAPIIVSPAARFRHLWVARSKSPSSRPRLVSLSRSRLKSRAPKVNPYRINTIFFIPNSQVAAHFLLDRRIDETCTKSTLRRLCRICNSALAPRELQSRGVIGGGAPTNRQLSTGLGKRPVFGGICNKLMQHQAYCQRVLWRQINRRALDRNSR